MSEPPFPPSQEQDFTGSPEPARDLSEFWSREFRRYEQAFSAGVELALYEALVVCGQEGIPPEPWMLKAMLLFMEDPMGRAHKKRGRTGNALSKYRQDLIHYRRWDVVVEVREQQELRRQEEAELAKRNIPTEKWPELLGYLNPGKNFEDAIEVAARLLLGTPAFGSESTIRASYFMVKRAEKDLKQHGRFLLIREQIRRRFGLDV